MWTGLEFSACLRLVQTAQARITHSSILNFARVSGHFRFRVLDQVLARDKWAFKKNCEQATLLLQNDILPLKVFHRIIVVARFRT